MDLTGRAPENKRLPKKLMQSGAGNRLHLARHNVMDPAKTVHRKLREAQGALTQRAFARRLGVSVGLVARLTTAPQNLTLSTIQKISHALHVTPSQLLDEADDRHRKG